MSTDPLRLFCRLRQNKLPFNYGDLRFVACLKGDIWLEEGDEDLTQATESGFYTMVEAFQGTNKFLKMMHYADFDSALKILRRMPEEERTNLSIELSIETALRSKAADSHQRSFGKLLLSRDGTFRREWATQDEVEYYA